MIKRPLTLKTCIKACVKHLVVEVRAWALAWRPAVCWWSTGLLPIAASNRVEKDGSRRTGCSAHSSASEPSRQRVAQNYTRCIFFTAHILHRVDQQVLPGWSICLRVSGSGWLAWIKQLIYFIDLVYLPRVGIIGPSGLFCLPSVWAATVSDPELMFCGLHNLKGGREF